MCNERVDEQFKKCKHVTCKNKLIYLEKISKAMVADGGIKWESGVYFNMIGTAVYVLNAENLET
jgi:hypothetical protein